jgi:hypothetical protein
VALLELQGRVQSGLGSSRVPQEDDGSGELPSLDPLRRRTAHRVDVRRATVPPGGPESGKVEDGDRDPGADQGLDGGEHVLR